MSEAALPGFLPAAPVLARLARWPAASLLLLCLILWLPGVFVLPPLDRDESRFAQASKQMVETGDFVDIRFSSGTRYNKPVGIYWLQSATSALFGGAAHDRIWAYRVPSLIGGYLSLLLVFWCARAFAPPPTAFAAAVLLGASVLMTAETQIATTDAVLLAALLGAQAVLMRLYLAEREPTRPRPGRWLVLSGWFAFAVGILVKGPVVAAVLGVTALALSLWDRDWRWLKTTRPLAGLLVTAIVVLPWMIAIQIQSHGAFYKQSLGHDFAAKLVSGQESHGAWPGYYLALATLTLWPAVLFVLPGLRDALRRRHESANRFLLAWAGASWLMFELVPTKLPHYILPVYPALAMLAALWVFAPSSNGETGWARALRYFAGAQFFVGLIALPLFAIIAPAKFGSGATVGVEAVAGLGAMIGAGALALFFAGRRPAAMGAAIVAAMVLILLLTVGVAPRLDALWLSPRIATLVTKDRRAGDPAPVIAGDAEPSLIFLLGTHTQIGVGADAARIAAQQGGLAVIEDRDRDAFLAALGALDTQAFAVDALDGYDYSSGRKMHITIYRVAVAPSPTTPPAE